MPLLQLPRTFPLLRGPSQRPPRALGPLSQCAPPATDPKLRTVGSHTDRSYLQVQLSPLPRGDPALGLPGNPGDGDAVGGIDSEGQGPREMAGLLDQIVLVAPRYCCLEVCVERVAVQLYQVQDGGGQGFHDFLCGRKGSGGRAVRPHKPRLIAVQWLGWDTLGRLSPNASCFLTADTVSTHLW